MKRFALLVSVAGLAALSFGQEANPKLVKSIGKPITSFSITTTTGQKFSTANLKGKVVLLDFWATWCGPCKVASHSMEKLHQNYGTKGLTVIAPDMNEYGLKGVAAKYKKTQGYTFHFTEDNSKLAGQLGIVSVPAIILVDKKGIIRAVWSNLPTGGAEQLYNQIEAKLKTLL